MFLSVIAAGEAAHCDAERAQIAQLEAETAVLRAKIAHAAPSDEPPPIPVLGVATIFHAGYVLRCFRSIDYPVEMLVLVHNGDDEEVGAAVEVLKRERPEMRVVRVPENSGCAGGWNRVLAANPAAPWWLIVNDDIAFPRGALRNIAAAVWGRLGRPQARDEPKHGHFKFWYQHGSTGWSCFALSARAVADVGTFDENIYPVYWEDQDYEWRLHAAGFASEHVRDVLVVHGDEGAEEYQSGSMTALVNETGAARVRENFARQLRRSDNRGYLLRKWGALKPTQPDCPQADAAKTTTPGCEKRWRTPFNRALPLSWWTLDDARRRCIRDGTGAAADGGPPCEFDRGLVDAAEAERRAAPPRPASSSFAQRLEKSKGQKAEL